MAKVELKAPIIEEIKKNIDGAQGAVLADYRGLTVAEDTDLRKQLREAGVVYKVYKNTYIKRAIAGTPYEGLTPMLEGPTAIAMSKTDATAPARIISKFAKNAPKLEIKCGIVEGTFYDNNTIKVIAEIPSRDELLSRLLGSMKSPITNMVRVMKQIADKGGASAAAPAPAAEAAAPAAEAPKAEAAPEAPAPKAEAAAPAPEAAPNAQA